MISFIEMIEVNITQSPIGLLLLELVVLALVSQILQRNKTNI